MKVETERPIYLDVRSLKFRRQGEKGGSLRRMQRGREACGSLSEHPRIDNSKSSPYTKEERQSDTEESGNQRTRFRTTSKKRERNHTKRRVVKDNYFSKFEFTSTDSGDRI